jgi:hypothetical protein
MKKINSLKLLFVAVTAAFSFTFSSCDKLKDITFEFTPNDVTFDIPAYTGVGPIEEQKVINSEEIDQLLKDKGIKKENLKSVHVKSVTFELIDTAAAPVTFDVINYIHALVFSDGIAEARFVNINTPTGTIVSGTVDETVDLAPYLKAATHSIFYRAENNAPIDHPTKIKVSAVYEIVGSL